MSNFIGIYDDALSKELCEQIISAHRGSGDLAPGKTGSGVDTKLKDSLDTNMLENPRWQPLFKQVFSAFQGCMRDYFIKHPPALVSGINPVVLDPATGEKRVVNVDNFSEIGKPHVDAIAGSMFRYTGFTVQSYKKQQGGYHYFHSEIYPQGQHNEPLHRELALLLYLNDVDDGGETEFFYQDIKVKPKAGRLAIFPAGFTHTHKGHIPQSSDKYVITAWLLFNRAEQLFGRQQ